MRKDELRKISLAFLGWWISLLCYPAMTIQVTGTPQLTPMLDSIYIAGTFNSWNPADDNFRLEHVSDVWTIDIEGTEGESIEFKFTRGVDWLTVEGNELGGVITDRTAIFHDGTTQSYVIAGWEDLPGTHTVTDRVRILDMDFAIPQLSRTRRIWICLPAGYETSNALYSVIYMHDGQNLFDNATSFAGEWSVDEALATGAIPDCGNTIVVGIDNGSSHRLDEYSPWVNAEYDEGGEGDLYTQFIVETLKPYVDANFSTMHDREHTAIAGSSLGALISVYMIAKHNDVFSKAGLFSPAYWFNPEIFQFVEDNPLPADSRIYSVCGDQESTDMVPDMNTMHNTILDGGVPFTNLSYMVQAGGQHNEYYWAQQFPDAYHFLFDCSTLVNALGNGHSIKAYPNPAHDTITLEMNKGVLTYIFILDSEGKKVLRESMTSKKTIDISGLARGSYVVRCSYMPEHTSTVMIGSFMFIKE